MFKLLEKPKTILASKSLIHEFVNLEPAPYDRSLSERRMLVYERILKAGAFRPVVWASAMCRETNTTYRVNGKHTSLLLSKQEPLPEFYVTVERYDVETLRDVGILYNTFDSNLSSRTTSDINQAFAATLPELAGTPSKLINLTVSSAAFLKWDATTIRKVPPAERAEELMDRTDFVKWLRDVVTNSSHSASSSGRPLMRAPVVSAMMATYDRAPMVAKSFWVAVRDESAPDRDDPTRVLARFLVRSVLGAANKNVAKKDMVTHTEAFVKCIRAWNAFREGTTTNLQYRVNDPMPKISK